MSAKELMHFRDMLVAGRGEALDRIHKLGAALRTLNEPETEMEEEAQKASLSEALDRLGENGKVKIELIDLALRKISVGDYGICESCGDDIALKRLEALPWTRLCVECAREYERKHRELPQPSQIAGSGALTTDEYTGMTGELLLKTIYDRIDKHFEVGNKALVISIRNGSVYLEGSVAGEYERQIVLQVLTEDMGISGVVDLLEVGEATWEEDDFGSTDSALS